MKSIQEKQLIIYLVLLLGDSTIIEVNVVKRGSKSPTKRERSSGSASITSIFFSSSERGCPPPIDDTGGRVPVVRSQEIGAVPAAAAMHL